MTSTRLKRSQIELDTELAGSAAPLYEQVYNALRSTIATNPRAAVGEALPSEAVLSKRYGVSRITVRQALQMLAAEGFIQKSKARRTRIAVPPQIMLRKQISSIEDITRGGAGRRSIVKSFRLEAPDEQVRKGFELDEKTKLRCLKLELLWQERLIGHSAIYFHPVYGEQLTKADFTDAVFIFPVLQRRFGLKIAGATVQVSAVPASATDVAHLKCPPGTALVDQTFVFRDERGQVVQVNRNQFLGEHYTLTYEVGQTGLAPDANQAMFEH
ncbi:GntR family transcriptional regulator [Bosea caraganae]|uniref:GntR family transcriptional regulator n=1 Tax=Bosea caraganae TaxID=2763117 RepID=A0A370L040_9HYPH|nr:GntR family transcriptional regulator [Bosea caraganae]RDJ20628.1 GntR family transcriptional regulator [Bosea caraganae]RDJ28905.1 GntR family transcriptional regulator [Bosea caraganae]